MIPTMETVAHPTHRLDWLANVAPGDWTNPRPLPLYDLVVIGGGTAGLVASAIAASLGARVALVEKHRLGGDCLNFGCVPSKALLSAAREVATCRAALAGGILTGGMLSVDGTAVMRRVHRLRAQISRHDAAARFASMDVHVFFGAARFTSRRQLDVAGARITFRRAIVATGTRPRLPDIAGLKDVPFHTNETIFELADLPASLLVIGAGPMGCELAQAFARLGTRVTLLSNKHGILPRQLPDASQIVRAALERDGVKIVCCGQNARLCQDGDKIVLEAYSHGQTIRVSTASCLVATGRVPNVTELDLEQAGVVYDAVHGIVVDDFLRTTNRRIYAAGDVCSPIRFTHAADFMARAAVRNALFAGRQRMSRLFIPHCVYTDPELAHIGLPAEQLLAEPRRWDTYEVPFHDVDRAVLEGADEGFVRAYTDRGSDRLVAATVVGPNAGDLIGQFALLMGKRWGLKALTRVVYPYPTRGEAVRKLGDRYLRRGLTPLVRALTGAWLRLATFCGL